MTIKGEIIAILPLVEGQGKNGQWFKQEYVMEIPGQYPKKVCFSLWNTKIDEYNLATGQTVTAHIEIESREHNGRWFTEVKCWKIDKEHSSQPSRSTQQPRTSAPVPQEFAAEDDGGDLPF